MEKNIAISVLVFLLVLISIFLVVEKFENADLEEKLKNAEKAVHSQFENSTHVREDELAADTALLKPWLLRCTPEEFAKGLVNVGGLQTEGLLITKNGEKTNFEYSEDLNEDNEITGGIYYYNLDDTPENEVIVWFSSLGEYLLVLKEFEDGWTLLDEWCYGSRSRKALEPSFIELIRTGLFSIIVNGEGARGTGICDYWKAILILKDEKLEVVLDIRKEGWVNGWDRCSNRYWEGELTVDEGGDYPKPLKVTSEWIFEKAEWLEWEYNLPKPSDSLFRVEREFIFIWSSANSEYTSIDGMYQEWNESLWNAGFAELVDYFPDIASISFLNNSVSEKIWFIDALGNSVRKRRGKLFESLKLLEVDENPVVKKKAAELFRTGEQAPLAICDRFGFDPQRFSSDEEYNFVTDLREVSNVGEVAEGQPSWRKDPKETAVNELSEKVEGFRVGTPLRFTVLQEEEYISGSYYVVETSFDSADEADCRNIIYALVYRNLKGNCYVLNALVRKRN